MQPAEERHVGPGQHREADQVGVLLDRGLDDLLRGLVQAGVDHLVTGVAQGPGDDLGAPVVTVETGLGHHDPDPATRGRSHARRLTDVRGSEAYVTPPTRVPRVPRVRGDFTPRDRSVTVEARRPPTSVPPGADFMGDLIAGNGGSKVPSRPGSALPVMQPSRSPPAVHRTPRARARLPPSRARAPAAVAPASHRRRGPGRRPSPCRRVARRGRARSDVEPPSRAPAGHRPLVGPPRNRPPVAPPVVPARRSSRSAPRRTPGRRAAPVLAGADRAPRSSRPGPPSRSGQPVACASPEPRRDAAGPAGVARRRSPIPLPSAPLLAGRGHPRRLGRGALQAMHPATAGAADAHRLAPASALSGTSAVGSASLLGGRARRELQPRAPTGLQAAADAQAKQRAQALSGFAVQGREAGRRDQAPRSGCSRSPPASTT